MEAMKTKDVLPVADAGVRPRFPIDEAAWIWRAEGGRPAGGAVFTDTAADAAALAREPAEFVRFRVDFGVAPGDGPLALEVSADERFVLLLDGREVGRGPHRGFPHRWRFQRWRPGRLAPGAHRLEAVCWRLGEHAPLSQLSVRGGFVLRAEGAFDARLTTGRAPWRVAPLAGTRMTGKGDSGTFGVGSECEVRGTSVLDEEPSAETWEEPAVVRGPVAFRYGLVAPGWRLVLSTLPDMMLERRTPGAIRRGPDLLRPGAVVPAHASVEALWDLGGYYCAYPELRVSGGRGARVAWDWAECLVGPDGAKRDRAAFEGLGLPRAFGDVFLPDGRRGARFTTPWWRCGRWARLRVETADEPLRVDGAAILETRAPTRLAAAFACDDPIPAALAPLCERSLQMCLHETFFDCPYYEQQMYPGDSRLQFLVATLFRDGRRYVRNALDLFDADLRASGLAPMNAPTRGTQESLPYTCCWAAALGDAAMLDDDPAGLRARFPGLVRALLAMEAMARPDGLLGRTPGWNYVDAVPGWPDGVPPDGDGDRPNAEINLQFLHALLAGETVAAALGERALAARFRARAAALRAAVRSAFWRPERALFASGTGRRGAGASFSEHAQALALLGGVLPRADARRCFAALASAPDLARTTVYFRHFLFETFFRFGRPDLFFRGLGDWKTCLDLHFSTLPEAFGPATRSDCHAWGAHPLWHLHAGVAGVRPAAPFYGRVLVAPQPAHLRTLRSATPTPHGPVRLDLRFDGPRVAGSVVLPPGLPGVFRWRGRSTPLTPGRNRID